MKVLVNKMPERPEDCLFARNKRVEGKIPYCSINDGVSCDIAFGEGECRFLCIREELDSSDDP